MGITFFIYVWHFNPRSPCGERRTTGEEAVIPMLISIHAPRAGSGYKSCGIIKRDEISIHAPRAGSGDVTVGLVKPTKISIHAPRAGSGGRDRGAGQAHENFNPRSPCGERRT